MLVADEHVSAARALSPELDGRYSPRQRFTACYPNLCQIDVLFWVEPPVFGTKVLFELFAAGTETPLVQVVVPASALPPNDWQRFEFRLICGDSLCFLGDLVIEGGHLRQASLEDRDLFLEGVSCISGRRENFADLAQLPGDANVLCGARRRRACQFEYAVVFLAGRTRGLRGSSGRSNSR